MADFDFEKAKGFDKGKVTFTQLDSKFLKIEMTAISVGGEATTATVIFNPAKAKRITRLMMAAVGIEEKKD